MQALTDAVVYLNDYPYESADAYASRIIALTSLAGEEDVVRGRASGIDQDVRRDHPYAARAQMPENIYVIPIPNITTFE